MFAGLVRTAFAAVALSLAASAVLAQERTAVVQPMVVMELFTSQGCSACPAADAVLAEHADRDDVLALAWHVDYWDYLGWSDTFAHADFTQRQRRYAKALGEGVYTPQLVVNGAAQGVGHRKQEVSRLLRSAAEAQRRDSSSFVPLAVRRRGTGYHVSLDARPAARARVEGATLFLVWFDPSHTVAVARGENAGRRVVYRNVVRGMQVLGSVADGRLEVSLSLDALRRSMPQGKACALILQHDVDGAPGPILGAAKLGDMPAG